VGTGRHAAGGRAGPFVRAEVGAVVLAGTVQQTDSGVIEVVAILLFLLLVIAATGYSLWQEEAVYRYEKEHRKRMRRELNLKLRDDEIEEDYK